MSQDMDISQCLTNSSRLQVSKFILMGLPGIHDGSCLRFWPSFGLMPRPSASLNALLKSMLFTVLLAWSQASSSAWLVDRYCLYWLPRDTTAPDEIEHCMCSNPGVTGLACDDITINGFYQLSLAWVLDGSDMALVFISYVLIFHSMLRLNSAEAIVKVLSTWSSHLILIFFFYTTIIVVSMAHLAGKAVPIFPVLLNVLNIVIPPTLKPMVYALRAQELRVGFQRVLELDENMSQK
ncbi:hypothetical protein HPG69_005817 [Diceros bicornis minor]|uniref:Uncharacterized protein n=1 Tax=Diceros bicornis minor TaxID=77932 RepID=A0A7J7ESM6_DICBM|nr:hypothetical protein HPG69_005817 [Diceros bicornis minor]